MDQPEIGSDLDIVIRRIVDAPIARVWDAWTLPEMVRRWWGPKHFTCPVCTIELRVGGRLLVAMRAPAELGGGDSYTTGIFERIVHHEVLEFSQFLSDASGNPVDPATVGMSADFPRRMATTVTFAPKGDLTRLSVVMRGGPAGQMHVFAFAGWHQQLDKLEAAIGS